jgi:hypothetical protein
MNPSSTSKRRAQPRFAIALPTSSVRTSPRLRDPTERQTFKLAQSPPPLKPTGSHNVELVTQLSPAMQARMQTFGTPIRG